MVGEKKEEAASERLLTVHTIVCVSLYHHHIMISLFSFERFLSELVQERLLPSCLRVRDSFFFFSFFFYRRCRRGYLFYLVVDPPGQSGLELHGSQIPQVGRNREKREKWKGTKIKTGLMRILRS